MEYTCWYNHQVVVSSNIPNNYSITCTFTIHTVCTIVTVPWSDLQYGTVWKNLNSNLITFFRLTVNRYLLTVTGNFNFNYIIINTLAYITKWQVRIA